ncbi:hypothetical protein [Nitrospirillum sp. BR 11828]|uniref:hypothetical protein n=1 Tax=Nitrospirillum sp. BR 11828 TaxID=3104325 RepID=UPI002ACAF765|nr:hypothetical protein [Nitrospirillum sp. BR 11828]MDZ5649039.1 hypothetical protein [Nitrospirillum sp. BR 11828]
MSQDAIPESGRPAGAAARILYRLRATLGRRATIASTLCRLWLGTLWRQARPALARPAIVRTATVVSARLQATWRARREVVGRAAHAGSLAWGLLKPLARRLGGKADQVWQATRAGARPALARLKAYPWRRLGARLLVPGQCALGILFGLSLLRRGDTVHMLAGGLLSLSFVLMAVIYAWTRVRQASAETAPSVLVDAVAGKVTALPEETPPAVETALPVTPATMPAPEAPPKPKRKRAPRKVTPPPVDQRTGT